MIYHSAPLTLDWSSGSGQRLTRSKDTARSCPGSYRKEPRQQSSRTRLTRFWRTSRPLPPVLYRITSRPQISPVRLRSTSSPLLQSSSRRRKSANWSPRLPERPLEQPHDRTVPLKKIHALPGGHRWRTPNLTSPTMTSNRVLSLQLQLQHQP